MSNTLHKGSIQKIIQNDTSITPRLQILQIKKIVSGVLGERYRLVLSDGQFYIQGILGKKCTNLAINGQLQKYTIIQLKEFVCDNISGKKICVVFECDIIQQLNEAIGKPQNALQDQQQQQQSHQQQQQPHQQQRDNNCPPLQNHKNCKMNQNQRMEKVQPVSSLNPYNVGWTIRVRCTSKDDVRHYSNQKGDGKFFGVDLLDSHGSEIRAVAFNGAADKFFSLFEKNGVYLISNGQVRLARKGYSHIKNDYSIALNEDTEVIPVNDNDIDDIAEQKYRFIAIEQVSQAEEKSFVDVIGIVIEVSDVESIISSRNQQQIKKRTLKIVDETGKIDVTLWNRSAEQYSRKRLKDAVIAMKGCKVTGFGGRSLSGGYIEINPQLKETAKLISWLKDHGGDTSNLNVTDLTSINNNSISPRYTVLQVKEMNLGNKIESKQDNNSSNYFSVVATINFIPQSSNGKPWYEANPDQSSDAKYCKVISNGDGTWICEKNGLTYNGYIPRYILRICATDFSGNIWLTAYDEAATKILNKRASEVEELFNNDREKYDLIFKEPLFKKYVFKCRAWSSVWKDSQRTNYDILDVELVNHVQESQKLIEKIAFLQTLKK